MLEKLKQLLKIGKKKPGGNNGDIKRFLSFDLYYQLSYMAVIAAGGVPRNQIFERAAVQSPADAVNSARFHSGAGAVSASSSSRSLASCLAQSFSWKRGSISDASRYERQA